MKSKRLRLDRIGERTKPPIEKQLNLPLYEEARIAMRSHIDKVKNHHRDSTSHGTYRSLIEMFNHDFVEFVRQISLSEYEPVEWPWQATHKLKGTSWNTEPTRKFPAGEFALSVAAVPIKRKVVILTHVKITRTFPVQASVYSRDGQTTAKRALLREYVSAMRARVKLRTIDRLTFSECDQLYNALRRASLQLLLS